MRLLAPLLLAAVVLAGCGPSLEKQVVGIWKADTAKTSITGEIAKDATAKALAMDMISKVSLEIKEDKTFDMQFIFPIKGTWSLAGNTLTLTADKAKGEVFTLGDKQSLNFNVESGGKSMSVTIEDPKFGGTLVMVQNEPTK